MRIEVNVQTGEIKYIEDDAPVADAAPVETPPADPAPAEGA